MITQTLITIIILLIIIIIAAIILNRKINKTNPIKKPKLVVLYSTQYRTWNDTCKNHLALMRHLAGSEDNCIAGIHYWNSNTPKDPPEPIRKIRYKHSYTNQNIANSPYFILNSITESTKIALNNAKQLYRNLYNEEMPKDQLILRLRPDVYIEDIAKFPKTRYGNNFYVSMWNSNHRPYKKNAPETSDLIGFTTLKTIELLLENNLKDNEKIFNQYRSKGREIKFIEQQLYTLLENAGTTIKNDPSLKIAILRKNGLERLTY